MGKNIENYFTISNRQHNDKINFKNILTYRKPKTLLENYFLLLFREDTTVGDRPFTRKI